jgi:hypothetical protein
VAAEANVEIAGTAADGRAEQNEHLSQPAWTEDAGSRERTDNGHNYTFLE